MSDNFAQTVKQQADIVTIIGDYVKLRKTGAQNYTGLCPFHKEKTGSFSVNATHGYFYCFGCHEKGDVFTFVMKLENISFPEAVRAVAPSAASRCPSASSARPKRPAKPGCAASSSTSTRPRPSTSRRSSKSPEAARAREYLTGRGVTPETIAKFRIGYAPDDFNHMRDRLKPHFSEEVLRASGLFSSKEQADGAPGPALRPLPQAHHLPHRQRAGQDHRLHRPRPRRQDEKGRDIAKYLNSPETALYTKGQVLFNLDKAKADMRTHDFALLVEGQMDCISVYMAGIHNVLATSGTAFTEMQVRLLSRFTKRVIVNFDPDTAGANAAEKSIALLTEEDFEVKVVTLEGGLDPDRFVREHGIQAYMAALRSAKRHSDYLIDRARQLFPGRTADAKVKALNFLLPHIRRMPNRIQRDEFAADAAQKLGIDSADPAPGAEAGRRPARRERPLAHRTIPPARPSASCSARLCCPKHDPARILAADQLSPASGVVRRAFLPPRPRSAGQCSRPAQSARCRARPAEPRSARPRPCSTHEDPAESLRDQRSIHDRAGRKRSPHPRASATSNAASASSAP